MRTLAALTLFLVALLSGCRKVDRDPQVEAMRKAVSEMGSRQQSIQTQVESLADLVKETRQACHASTEALKALETSLEADRMAEIEKKEKGKLQEQLNRKMHLAENLREHQQYAAAYRALKELAEEYPDAPQGHRARIELIELGITPEDMRKSDEEVGKLLESNVRKRQAARSLMEKAHRLEQSGDTMGAVKAFLKLAREHPDTEGARWVTGMLALQGLTEESINLLSGEEREEAMGRFAARRKIETAQRGREHPNRETAAALLEIIKQSPDDPSVEDARRYFYRHGIVFSEDELDALTLDLLQGTVGQRIDLITAAEKQVHRARALLEQGHFADAAMTLQKVVDDYPDVPSLREAREHLRGLGMVDVVVTDENRDEINTRVGEMVSRQREWERAERLIRGRQYFDAAKILQHFRDDIPDSRQAREAEEILGRWNLWNVTLDENARDEVNEIVAAAESARRTFERAEMLHHMGKIGPALRTFLELARKHPETGVGKEAEERLRHYGIAADAEEITDDEVAAATIRRAAREAHGRAHQMMRSGRYLEAIEVFREIAEVYTEIPEGHEAERILKGCGAWQVEITDQNQDEIAAALHELMGR